MPNVSKKADITSKSMAKKKLCPNCGHDEFEAVSTGSHGFLDNTSCAGNVKAYSAKPA
jgi:hypothetical protein